MKMADAMGWLAAAVLAAGLNSAYHQGGLEWAHQLADRMEQSSNSTLAVAWGRADQFLTEVRVIADRHNSATCPLSSALERVQSRIENNIEAKMDRTEAGVERFNDVMSARQQAELNRFEARRNHIEAQLQSHAMQFRFMTADFNPTIKVPVMRTSDFCPRIRVKVPQPPQIRIPSAPVIHIQNFSVDPL